MNNHQPPTERSDDRRPCEGALALLEAMVSLMALDDPDEVFAGVAEVAARHIDLSPVVVFAVDYDAGVIRRVARAERHGSDVRLELEELRRLDGEPGGGEEQLMEPGRPLAEFAIGERPLQRRRDEEAGAHRLLVQMRRGGSDGPRAVVGVIEATGDAEPAQEQVRLLRALAGLGAAAIESAGIDGLRSELISTVSHELRTPLAGIRAYNELLLDEDVGEINEEQRVFLQRIDRTCLQLDRMIDEMMDLSRMRAGEVQIPREPVDVRAVIEHIIDTLSPEARRREVDLRSEIDEALPLISSNADRLTQVLFNLVGNAVKYVSEGGNVLVRAGVEELSGGDELPPGVEKRLEGCEGGRCVLIEVIDDGPGIAPEEQSRVFEEFYRARRMEGATEGSGLGLAIARRLTRLLGGTLDLTSEPDEGSTFYLAFPLTDEPGSSA